MSPESVEARLARVDERTQAMSNKLDYLVTKLDSLPCDSMRARVAVIENGIRRRAGIISAVVAGVVSAFGWLGSRLMHGQ